MDNPGPSLSFRPVLAVNLPLGVGQSSSSSSSNPNPGNVIDLTADDDSPPPQSATLQSNPNLPSNDHEDDDDVIFTGRNVAPIDVEAENRQSERNERHQRPENSIQPQNGNPRSGLGGRIADLTAGIYAGYFSSHPSNPRNSEVEQGPSAIRIRDSPPRQQARRPRSTSGPSFGGGGRFSGGQFSGLLTTGLSGLRGLAAGARYHLASSGDSLQEIMANWNRNSQQSGVNLLPVDESEQFVPLDVDAHFLAVWGFDAPLDLARAHPQREYEERDSHPKKVGIGFSNEIIPLDREIFTLDDSPHLQAIKQDSRPVCASCNQDLLVCQDSSSDGKVGRRPWILMCGHVVDSECLEMAKARARAEKRSLRGRGRRGGLISGRRVKSMRLPESPTAVVDHQVMLPSNKKRRTASCLHKGSIQNPSTAASECAIRRQERAKAREAKKSIERAQSTSSLSKTTSTQSEVIPETPKKSFEEEFSLVRPRVQDNKGKGKAEDECTNEKIIVISPETVDSIKSSLKPTILPLSLTWTQCPVKGCEGPRGDLLAIAGSKTAPWEMFV